MNPRSALRGVMMVAVIVCLLDWGLKWAHPLLQGWWIPHSTERPEMLLTLLTAICCFVVAATIRSPLTTLGGGLMLGGTTANMVDLWMDGVVWDMIPFPWDPDRVGNLADFAIMLGASFLVIGLLRFWKHHRLDLKVSQSL